MSSIVVFSIGHVLCQLLPPARTCCSSHTPEPNRGALTTIRTFKKKRTPDWVRTQSGCWHLFLQFPVESVCAQVQYRYSAACLKAKRVSHLTPPLLPIDAQTSRKARGKEENHRLSNVYNDVTDRHRGPVQPARRTGTGDILTVPVNCISSRKSRETFCLHVEGANMVRGVSDVAESVFFVVVVVLLTFAPPKHDIQTRGRVSHPIHSYLSV